jgi:hypothetical protein
MALSHFRCNDCGIDVLEIGDWYMAAKKLWEDLGLGWHANLCLLCLERRLGHRVVAWIDIFPTASSSLAVNLSDRIVKCFERGAIIKRARVTKHRRMQ